MDEKNNQNRELSQRNHEIFDPFFDGFFRFPSLRTEFNELDKLMKTDIAEDEIGYKLEIDLPGFDKENINIDFNNGYLTVEACRASVAGSEKKTSIIKRERNLGSLVRSFYVGEINENEINAKLEKGVLTIHIPRVRKNETKKHIEIK